MAGCEVGRPETTGSGVRAPGTRANGDCIGAKPGFQPAGGQVPEGRRCEGHHGGRLKTLAEEGPGLCRKVRDLKIQPADRGSERGLGGLFPLALAQRGSWPGCWSHWAVTLAVLPAQDAPPSPDPRTPLPEGLLESLL